MSKKEDKNLKAGKKSEVPEKASMGEVSITFLFGDEEAFKKKTVVEGYIPGKGKSMIPTKEVLTAAARNLYNIMLGLDQDRMVVHIHDGGPFAVKVDKRMEIRIGALPEPPKDSI